MGINPGPLPTPSPHGRPRRDRRQIVDGILWVKRTGAPWRDLPQEFGPWATVWDLFDKWNSDGTLDTILSRLRAARMDVVKVDDEFWCLGGTVVRAARCAAGGAKKDLEEPPDHALGRSRGGYSTKIQVLCDGHGRPLHFHLTAGQAHEATALVPLREGADERIVDSGGEPVAWPVALAGDKGYRVGWIDQLLLETGIRPVIPSRENQDREAYRRRSIVECLIGWLKESPGRSRDSRSRPRTSAA